MPKPTKIFPVFAVRDLNEALTYYRERLDFTVAWTWGAPVSRAGVAFEEIEIQLEAAGFGAPPGPSVVYIHMADVATYAAACEARGATIAMELGDRPWGMQDFRVLDPSGNRIGFGSEITE